MKQIPDSLLAQDAPRAHVYRFAIAGVQEHAIAKRGQQNGINGNAMNGLGFGNWGIEPCCIIESAGTWQEVSVWILSLLRSFDQECAYFTIDGASPALLYADGRIESL